MEDKVLGANYYICPNCGEIGMAIRKSLDGAIEHICLKCEANVFSIKVKEDREGKLESIPTVFIENRNSL